MLKLFLYVVNILSNGGNRNMDEIDLFPTFINTYLPSYLPPQRISVFEPYTMRDTVQHFCEKHLDKIKAFMQKVFVKLPLPIRCGIEGTQAVGLSFL